MNITVVAVLVASLIYTHTHSLCYRPRVRVTPLQVGLGLRTGTFSAQPTMSQDPVRFIPMQPAGNIITRKITDLASTVTHQLTANRSMGASILYVPIHVTL